MSCMLVLFRDVYSDSYDIGTKGWHHIPFMILPRTSKPCVYITLGPFFRNKDTIYWVEELGNIRLYVTFFYV